MARASDYGFNRPRFPERPGNPYPNAEPGENDPPEPPPPPTGLVRVITGYKPVYTADGNRTWQPQYDLVPDPTYRRPTERVGRDPLQQELDRIQIERERARQADYPEDRQMGRDIGYGNLELGRGNLEVNQRQVALQELINQEGSWAQRAADALGRGHLTEAIEARKKANEFSLRRAELEEQDLGLRAELGFAASRQAGERNVMQEAEMLGYDRGGRETASERQRGFTNLFAQQQARTQQGNVEADRRQSGLNLQSQIEQRGYERTRQMGLDEEDQRRNDVNRMIASRRPGARMVTSGSRGVWA